MSYNSFPIQVQDLVLGNSLQATLDQNGFIQNGPHLVEVGQSNPVTSILGYIPSSLNVMLRFFEELPNADSLISELDSRTFSIRKQISGFINYVFQVTDTALTWTDVSGNTTTMFTNKGRSLLSFSNAVAGVFSGDNAMVESVDSSTLHVGNMHQSLSLISSLAGVSLGSSTSLNISGPVKDHSGSAGVAGRVLTSTGTGVEWSVNGVGDINTVDTVSGTNVTVHSGIPLELSSSTLSAGSYLVQYSAELTFSPLAGAGIQESMLSSSVTDGTTFQGVYEDTTVRNITGPKTFYLQSSSVVVLATEGTLFGFLNITYTGGLGATVTVSNRMTSTLVNV